MTGQACLRMMTGSKHGIVSEERRRPLHIDLDLSLRSRNRNAAQRLDKRELIIEVSPVTNIRGMEGIRFSSSLAMSLSHNRNRLRSSAAA